MVRAESGAAFAGSKGRRAPRLLALAALLAAAFAAAPARAIEGGSPARAGDAVARAAVAVGTVTQPEDRYNLARCSGVLVNPDTVLTAAHCVRGDPVGAGVVFFRGGSPAGPFVPVSNISSYATERGALLSNEVDVDLSELSLDLAVLHLSAPVRDRTPLPVAVDPRRVPVSLTLAGAGLSGRTVGALRTANLRPVAATSTGLTLARVVGARVCSGDSGGPVVARDRRGTYVWGVASAVITRTPPCGTLVLIAPASQVFASGR